MPPILGAISAPTVTPVGTTGAVTYDYKLVGVTANGNKSAVTAAGQTTTGNAVLDATDLNRVTWTDIAGFVSYEIWRTASGGIPASTGLIGTVLSGVQTFDDIGYDAVAGTPNASNNSGLGEVLHLQAFNGDLNVVGDGIGVGTYQLQGSFGGDWLSEGSALTADGVLVVTRKYVRLRFSNSAFTSGTPVAYCAGDNE